MPEPNTFRRPRRGESRRPLACVIGEVDLVRALGIAGIPAAVVARPGDPARYSRFTTTCIDWIDPWRQPRELVERLVSFASAEPEPPVLFYDGDWDLLLVSRHREELRGSFRFVVPDDTLVEDLVDKARFQRLSGRLDLPVPPARVVPAGEQPSETELELRLPLIAKPLTRQHETWRPLTTAKAVQITSRGELDAFWRRLEGSGVDVLLQEAVPGAESRIESYHVYRDEAGEIVGEFTGRKLRTYPREYGYSTALELAEIPDARELGRELTQRLDLRGVAKLDFKRDPDGDLLLLEVNPRFNLWHYLGAKAGVNLPELVYRDLIGAERPVVPRARPRTRWCNLAHDWQAARLEGIPLVRWLPWALSSDAMRPFAWDDPAPAFRSVAWLIRTRGTGAVRRRSAEALGALRRGIAARL